MRIFLLCLPCAALGFQLQNTFSILGNEIEDAESFLLETVEGGHEQDMAGESATQFEGNTGVVDGKSASSVRNEIPDPPPHDNVAKMARYLVHYSDWLAMATISTRGPLTGTPFASIFSFSDGTKDKSSGWPYFYLTDMDMSAHDLKKNPKASVTMSLAQGDYCRDHQLDPEDPRCAHVILAGEVVRVQPHSTEEEFAKEALFSRHPVMPDWPANHGWYFAKLNVTAVILLDYFGGAIDIDVEEYFSTQP